jgi:hypothetical protein
VNSDGRRAVAIEANFPCAPAVGGMQPGLCAGGWKTSRIDSTTSA